MSGNAGKRLNAGAGKVCVDRRDAVLRDASLELMREERWPLALDSGGWALLIFDPDGRRACLGGLSADGESRVQGR